MGHPPGASERRRRLLPATSGASLGALAGGQAGCALPCFFHCSCSIIYIYICICIGKGVYTSLLCA